MIKFCRFFDNHITFFFTEAHQWKGHAVELQVKWSVGESTWELLAACNELAALDGCLALMGAKDWMDLPKCAARDAHTRP